MAVVFHVRFWTPDGEQAVSESQPSRQCVDLESYRTAIM